MAGGAWTEPFWAPDEIRRGARLARDQIGLHRVIAYPTETVYGFGGGIDRESVESLVALKRRPTGKPFLLLVDGPGMIDRLDLAFPSYAANFAARFWPGPLTLVLRGGQGRVPDRLRGPEGGVAVRWTSHAATAELIRLLGDPITSTSANLPGVPPALAASEIVDQWTAAIARGTILVLDGGRVVPSPPSTVVDCTGRRPRVIRPGAISSNTLRETVPELVGDA